MLKCVVVDDDSVFLDLMSHYINKNPNLDLRGSFLDSAESLKTIEKDEADVLFIDIDMPKLNGMDLVKSLKTRPQVVFVTAHEEFAVEAFDYQVTDYLLKPIDESRFKRAVSRVIDNHQQKSGASELQQVCVKVGSKFQNIHYRDILSIDASGDYVEIHTVNDMFLVLSSLGAMEEMLSSKYFMRIHRKHIVRLKAIDSVDQFEVTLTGGKTIPVSRRKKADFLSRIQLQS